MPILLLPSKRPRTLGFVSCVAHVLRPSSCPSRAVGTCSFSIPARLSVWRSHLCHSRHVQMAMQTSPSTPELPGKLTSGVQATGRDKGTLFLCLLNLVAFIVDKMILSQYMSMLYLSHNNPRIFQLFTSLFCHGSFQHLTGNLFLLLVFGRFVEEDAGAAGVILAYLVCGACANVASLLLLRGGGIVSLGASGSVFALFSLAILVRFRIRIGRLVETFILSTYVVSRVTDEFKMVASSGAPSSATVSLGGTPVRVNHVAHIAGALAGVFLVLLLNFVLRHSHPPGKKGGK